METELKEKIVIEGAESAVSKLGMISGAANRVMHAFHGLGEVMSVAGGLAGVWQVAEGVREVDRLYQAVMRVQDMTGMAAEKAHSLFDMFELSGVEMESAERIITSMTRQGQKLEDGMAAAGGAVSRMSTLMTQLGVKTKDGPEERIIAMSKAAKAGKLDMAELTMAFAIPRSTASAVMSMLKQGPEKLQAIQKETLAGADLIDNKTLDSYRQMLQVRRELKDAWGDLIGVFYKNLIPVITKVLQEIKAGFQAIEPITASIGKFLSDHMSAVVASTKTYLALLVASKAINVFTEEKLGVLGRGKQVYNGISGMFAKRAAAAGAMDFFEAKAANPALGIFEKAGGGGGVIATIMAGIKGIGPVFMSMGTAIAGFLPALVAAGPLLLVLAAVVGVLVGVIGAWQKNLWGIRDALLKTFGSIWDHLKNVIGAVADVMGALWMAIKPLLGVIGFVLLAALEQFAFALDKLAWLIDTIVKTSPLARAAAWLGDKFGDATAAADDGKRGSGGAPPAPNMDFRGSKFEINNNFPPGIDGGRVAVVFGDELAKLGERRLDAGVRPLFSYR